MPVSKRKNGPVTALATVLKLLGDDPQTLQLAIDLLDRMYEIRRSRNRSK